MNSKTNLISQQLKQQKKLNKKSMAILKNLQKQLNHIPAPIEDTKRSSKRRKSKTASSFRCTGKTSSMKEENGIGFLPSL